jgi:hypothetical protein
VQAGRITEILGARMNELRRRSGPAAARAASATAEAVARAASATLAAASRARARLEPWLRRELRVESARMRLAEAALAHESSLLAARVRVARARLAHRLRCRRAAREAAAVEKEATRVVARATERFRELCRPQRLADYGPFTLLDNGLEGPDWEVSLKSVRAVLVPPDAAALKGAGTRAFPVPAAGASPRRGSLVIRTRQGVSALECKPDDPRASEFAELVNVAALNPRRFEETRTDQIQQAADHLEAVRTAAARRIADARAALDEVRRDTTRIEEAERVLARIRADTRERDRRRALLAAAKRDPLVH